MEDAADFLFGFVISVRRLKVDNGRAGAGTFKLDTPQFFGQVEIKNLRNLGMEFRRAEPWLRPGKLVVFHFGGRECLFIKKKNAVPPVGADFIYPLLGRAVFYYGSHRPARKFVWGRINAGRLAGLFYLPR